MTGVYGFSAVIVSILAGMLFQNARFNSLEARMSELSGRIDRREGELGGRLDRMPADLSRFYRTLGEHDAKIDGLGKKG